MSRRRHRIQRTPQFEELWSQISEFPDYSVSNLGRIYTERYGEGRFIQPSPNNYGHIRVALVREQRDVDIEGNIFWRNVRLTRSVAPLVAQAFVEAPNLWSDHVILLDGNLSNVRSDNLAWRTESAAYQYARQLKQEQPVYFRNLRVTNLDLNIEYDNIVQAGMCEGLLFKDIWRSTYSGWRVPPYGHVFEVTERV